MLCHLVAWIEQSIPDELLVNPDVRPDLTSQYLKIKGYDHYKCQGGPDLTGHTLFKDNSLGAIFILRKGVLRLF